MVSYAAPKNNPPTAVDGVFFICEVFERATRVVVKNGGEPTLPHPLS